MDLAKELPQMHSPRMDVIESIVIQPAMNGWIITISEPNNSSDPDTYVATNAGGVAGIISNQLAKQCLTVGRSIDANS